MTKKIVKITIDGKECVSYEGTYLAEVARENNIYIPTLCNIPGVKPRGACRICTVKVNGRLMTACTTPVSEGMTVENNVQEINQIRSTIIELLFAEGNHFCPACEKSGNCDLQALAYRFRVMVPRFPYLFPNRPVEAQHPKLLKDHNRCILCKRCIRAIKDESGKNIFAFKRRGHKVIINIESSIAHNMTDDLAQKAMDICPVGAIIHKGQGFKTPVGHRKYDENPIGCELENYEPAKL